MTLEIAAGLAEQPRMLAVLLLLGWALVYAISCWLYPFTAHRHCSGTGKHRSPSGRSWRPCRGCGGSGTRVRWGRRLWDSSRSGPLKRP